MRRIAIGILALVGLSLAGVAQAEVTNEFGFQLKDIKTNGRFTVVFNWRSYDTTGAVPPLLVRNYIRLPAGARLAPEFLKTNRFLCNYKLLHDTKNPAVCKNAEFGQGRVMVDARLVTNPTTGKPYVTDLIPTDIYLYLGKAQAKGAVASYFLLAIPDASSPVVQAAGIVKDTKVALIGNFYNDPTPDGRYGYRIENPAGPVQGLRISVAEVNVTLPGLTLRRRIVGCSRKRAGRCVKRWVKRKAVFWFKPPQCPADRTIWFQSLYQYENLASPLTREASLLCPRFSP